MSNIKKQVKDIHNLPFIQTAKRFAHDYIRKHPEVDYFYLQLRSKSNDNTFFEMKYEK